jgi:hypothetical protein
VIAEVLDSLERTSGPGWPRRRCQVMEEAVVARASGSKIFHRQAKRIKLHRAGVIGGETTDRKETLDKVRSYQHIVEVKWSGKHRVAY